MASSSSSSAVPGATPPIPAPPKKPFLRRIFPLLLVVNFAAGAYVLRRTTKKEHPENEEVMRETPAAPVEEKDIVASVEAPIAVSAVQSVQAPEKVLPPIPLGEQMQLFNWILAEKRKVKSVDSAEKKKIDEEKAMLKHYIRSGSIPSV